MSEKSTSDLCSELIGSASIDSYLSRNRSAFLDSSIADLLTSLYRNKSVSKAALARKAGMSEVYLHQVFSAALHSFPRLLYTVASDTFGYVCRSSAKTCSAVMWLWEAETISWIFFSYFVIISLFRIILIIIINLFDILSTVFKSFSACMGAHLRTVRGMRCVS